MDTKFCIRYLRNFACIEVILPKLMRSEIWNFLEWNFLISKSKGFDPGAQQISSIDGMVLLYVPAGKFEMGYVDGKKDEGPVHTVFLDAFWIDQTEVTNEMYRKCEQAGICEKPTQATYAFKRTNSATRDDYYVNSEYDNYPALYINWSQASDYCEWAGRRLPTEAERMADCTLGEMSSPMKIWRISAVT